jgi:hypothetical protein
LAYTRYQTVLKQTKRYSRWKNPLKPTKHFKEVQNKREVFGFVTQCRTGHSYTGEFRRVFLPLSPEPMSCPCDAGTLETRSHILQECPRFTKHPKIHKEASRDIALPEILGTKKGIAALSEFIRKSGAFTRSGQPPTPVQPPNFENEPEAPAIPNLRLRP